MGGFKDQGVGMGGFRDQGVEMEIFGHDSCPITQSRPDH